MCASVTYVSNTISQLICHWWRGNNEASLCEGQSVSSGRRLCHEGWLMPRVSKTRSGRMMVNSLRFMSICMTVTKVVMSSSIVQTSSSMTREMTTRGIGWGDWAKKCIISTLRWVWRRLRCCPFVSNLTRHPCKEIDWGRWLIPVMNASNSEGRPLRA